MAERITARSTDYSDWYIDIVTEAKLADYSPVRGCMVIRPYGYAIWENMQSILDSMFKESGHSNAYFPMLIPEDFMKREADHVEGFAPELAVVTHGGGEELEEPLVIRPTSETIIWNMYKKWIQSYRDLPLLINQWANVMRWEKRTRLFLRTSEFLWQEGHTAHASAEEAQQEAIAMLNTYANFAEQYMAMPVLKGKKSESEKFAGAVATYAVEAMMQDGKALQAGTSHFLGQNFARAFDVQFQNKAGKLEYVWATSWGVSTRLIGALIMTHSDDRGLVLPPKLAPTKVVLVPIFRTANKSQVIGYARKIFSEIQAMLPPRTVIIDEDEQNSPGWKFAEYEMRGIPLRIEIGQRDMDAEKVVIQRRDTLEKTSLGWKEAVHSIPELLDSIQKNLYKRATEYRKLKTREVTNYDEFREIFTPEGGVGFVTAPWDGSSETEMQIKSDTKATIRVLPENEPISGEVCMISGKPASYRAIFARSY